MCTDMYFITFHSFDRDSLVSFFCLHRLDSRVCGNVVQWRDRTGLLLQDLTWERQMCYSGLFLWIFFALSEEQAGFWIILFCHCLSVEVDLTCVDGHAQPLSRFLSNASNFLVIRPSGYFNLLFTVRQNRGLGCIDFFDAFISELFEKRTASTNTSTVSVQLLEDLAFQPTAHDVSFHMIYLALMHSKAHS